MLLHAETMCEGTNNNNNKLVGTLQHASSSTSAGSSSTRDTQGSSPTSLGQEDCCVIDMSQSAAISVNVVDHATPISEQQDVTNETDSTETTTAGRFTRSFLSYYSRTKNNRTTCHPWLWYALVLAAIVIVILVLVIPKPHASALTFTTLEQALAAVVNPANVTTLDFTAQNINGTIPTMALCKFTQLKVLKLGDNYIRGTIPTELSTCLPNLNELFLGQNYFIGTVPTMLGLLSNLTTLRLNGNYLSGTIPSELGNLSQLQYLSLSDNWFTGNLPSTFTALTKLQVLRLSDNSLSGTIPTSFEQMTLTLQTVSLHGNDLLVGNTSFLCSGIRSNTIVDVSSTMHNLQCDCCTILDVNTFNYY